MQMFDLTAFQRDLLYVIAGSDDETYGLEIKETLEEFTGDAINHGRLYPNLDQLVESGYLEKGQLDRRTNTYELTDDARELINDRREWEDTLLD